MSRIELSPQQLAGLHNAVAERERAIIDNVLQQPDYPPLPPCPKCGAAVERMDSMTESPPFGVDERAVLLNLEPCGHKFRAVVDLEGSP